VAATAGVNHTPAVAWVVPPARPVDTRLETVARVLPALV